MVRDLDGDPMHPRRTVPPLVLIPLLAASTAVVVWLIVLDICHRLGGQP